MYCQLILAGYNGNIELRKLAKYSDGPAAPLRKPETLAGDFDFEGSGECYHLAAPRGEGLKATSESNDRHMGEKLPENNDGTQMDVGHTLSRHESKQDAGQVSKGSNDKSQGLRSSFQRNSLGTKRYDHIETGAATKSPRALSFTRRYDAKVCLALALVYMCLHKCLSMHTHINAQKRKNE